MSGAALPVRERFSAANGEIVRKLRIGGVCGVTRAEAASSQGAEALSQRELRDAWDGGFLRGGIANERGGRRRAVRIADVFCGAGGLSYGVSEAGSRRRHDAEDGSGGRRGRRRARRIPPQFRPRSLFQPQRVDFGNH